MIFWVKDKGTEAQLANITRTHSSFHGIKGQGEFLLSWMWWSTRREGMLQDKIIFILCLIVHLTVAVLLSPLILTMYTL